MKIFSFLREATPLNFSKLNYHLPFKVSVKETLEPSHFLLKAVRKNVAIDPSILFHILMYTFRSSAYTNTSHSNPFELLHKTGIEIVLAAL